MLTIAMSEHAMNSQKHIVNNELGRAPSGFAAGTLVHTKEGLVAIEQIKVGDWVLSKFEDNDQVAYKQVLKASAHTPTTVTAVRYRAPDQQNILGQITAALNSSFWVAEQGWTAVSELTGPYRDLNPQFRIANGNLVFTVGLRSIYVSDVPNVGWKPSHQGDVEAQGSLWDYANHKLIANNVFAISEVQYGELDDPYLKLPVFEIEVEDFQTYFVGEHGVWVSARRYD